MKTSCPPHSTEMEQSVLGAIMSSSDLIVHVSEVLNPEDFYHQAHSQIYETCINLYRKRMGIDLVTITNDLEAKGLLAQIGGATYLSKISAENFGSTNTVNHAKIVREKAKRRTALRVLEKLSADLSDETIRTTSAIGNVVEGFSKLMQDKSMRSGDMRTILNELTADWVEINKTGLGLSTGVAQLDEAIKGYRPGHYWVVMAYTSYGKTSASVMLVDKLLKNHPQECIVFFSAEMTSKDIVQKLVSQRCERELYDSIKNCDSEDVCAAVASLETANLFVYDDCLTPAKMAMRLRILRLQGFNPKVVFIDYLQNLNAPGSDYERMTTLTNDVQRLAIDENLCVVALSQIPDEAAKVDSHMIKAKGSGAIAATAGFVVQLIRDTEAEEGEFSHRRVHPVKCLIKKNRYGVSKRSFDLFFDSTTGLYHDKEIRPNPRVTGLQDSLISQQFKT